ncbi:MAG: phage/plasmid primase, P4 family [Sulfobacillus sp.]
MGSNELYAFLNRFRVAKGESFTHTSIGAPAGSFNIPPAEQGRLCELLYQTAFVQGTPVHLTEKPMETGPLRFDFDFRFPLETLERKYAQHDVRSLVKTLNELVTEVIDVPLPYVQAFVFEREAPYKFQGNVRDGLHVMYPMVHVQANSAHLIRRRLLGLCPAIFGSLPLKNTYEEVVDESVLERNNWLMYGCCKPSRLPYKLTGIFNCDMDELELDQYEPQQLIHLLSIRRTDQQVFPVVESKKSELELLKKINKTAPAKKVVVRQNRTRTNGGYDLEEVRQLVRILDPGRADDWKTWMEVGWCLHNLDESLLIEWIEFSRKSAKFKDGECEKLWGGMREEGLGIGSLHRWAKMDNNDGYQVIIRNSLNALLHKSGSGTTFDVAKVVHHMYKHQYVCVSLKHGTWYEFRHHRWYEIDTAVTLRSKLSNEVVNEYLREINHLNLQAIGVDNENKDQFLTKVKALSDLTYKLRDYVFKDRIIKECMILFYDETFTKRLDSDVHLLGFENGVYDLKKGEFRDGRPEDMVSMTTGNDYLEFEPDDEIVQEVERYMRSVFVPPELREFVWNLLASFLVGLNPHERFYMGTGGGANSKSKLLELFQYAMGEYATTISTSVLTQKKAASNSATPDIARLKGKRFVSLQELEENEKLNIGLMKEWTGGDVIIARPMYKEPVEFKPQFKLMLCCNHMPKVPPNDDATWRRIRVIHFSSKFCDVPNPENPLEFPIDPFLSEKLHRWKEAFMYLLIQCYNRSAKFGLHEPDCVLQATRDYQRVSDVFVEFMDDRLLLDAGSNVKLEESYREFKNWWKSAYDGKAPIRASYKSALERRLGKYDSKNGWKGYRLLTNDEDLPVLV